MEEAHKEYRTGFQLDAAGLKGVVAAIDQHLRKISGSLGHEVIKVSLMDGSAQTLPDINAVISLQNVGRKEIRSIDYSRDISGPSIARHSIQIAFAQSDDKYDPNANIIYKFEGADRDWIRSAQIDIEEIISGLSRPNIVLFYEKLRPLIMIVVMGIMAWAIFSSAGSVEEGRISRDELKRLSDTLSKVGNDASLAVYKYAEWNADAQKENISLKWTFLPVVVLMALSALSRSLIDKIFKSHIFYFGGMISIVNQRRFMHGIFWVSIVLAVVVGVSVNYLSSAILK